MLEKNSKPNISIISYGVKYGSPYPECDIRIDLRSRLANPQDHLPKGVTGLDKIVKDTVLGTTKNKKVYASILSRCKKKLKAEELNEMTIGFCCTSGIHRSVVFAEQLYKDLKKDYSFVSISHVHLKK